jgi:hypothetical protein
MPEPEQEPRTFEEALETLKTGWIDYEVRIGSHEGALMTRQTWLECVEEHSFIDYDGMGHQIAADGTIIMFPDRPSGWIKPSEALKIAPEAAYVLWYNR